MRRNLVRRGYPGVALGYDFSDRGSASIRTARFALCVAGGAGLRTASPPVKRCSKSAMSDDERRTDIALAVLAGASIVGIVLIGRAA